MMLMFLQDLGQFALAHSATARSGQRAQLRKASGAIWEGAMNVLDGVIRNNVVGVPHNIEGFRELPMGLFRQLRDRWS